MLSIASLAPVLQTLFTSQADRLAHSTGFVRRRRRFSGSQFLQALVLGWLRRPQAPLETLALPLDVSRQALHQRFDDHAAAFCRAALLEGVAQAVQARPEALPLLERFSAVYLDDTTQAWLPDALAERFAGCGSGRPGQAKARLKLFLRWEVLGGRVCHLGLHPGRAADVTAADGAAALPAGALRLADLAFADFDALEALSRRGVFWITRVPAQARLHPDGKPSVPLAGQLRAWRRAGVRRAELACRLGNKSSAHGRLVALRCPQEVSGRRLQRLGAEARRRNRSVSARQRELCYWTVYFSNVPAEWLTAEQVWLVARLRWQIELLFKRLKSEGGLGVSRSEQPQRVECEWYLKLLGQLVRLWLTLLRGGPLIDVNPRARGAVATDALAGVFAALGSESAVAAVLADVSQQLGRVRRRTRRRTRKTLRDLLSNAA